MFKQENAFEKALKNWGESYFLQPFLIFVTIYVLIKLIESDNKLPFRKLFILYTANVLGLFLFSNVIYIFSNLDYKDQIRYGEITNYIFNGIEIYVFYSFFLNTLKSIKVKLVVRLLMASLISFYCMNILKILITNSAIGLLKIGDTIAAINLFLLLLVCLLYFYEIYRDNKFLSTRHSLIVLCLFGYCIISIPILLIAHSLVFDYHRIFYLLFTLHYAFIGILCFSFVIYTFPKLS
jgi:hypothetical protein